MSDKVNRMNLRVVSFIEFEKENKLIRKVKVTVRFTQKEFMMLKQQSKLYDVENSTYIRKTLMDKIESINEQS